MPDQHPSFLEPAHLRSMFLASLQRAVNSQQLTPAEQSELTAAALQLPSSNGRFYTLTFHQAPAGAPSMAGALVIDGVGQTSSHKCYLYTLSGEFKPFSHGAFLLGYLGGVGVDAASLKIILPPQVSTLAGVAAQAPDVAFTAATLEPLVGDVFAAQRLSWLRWRSQGIEVAVDCLFRMPSVESAGGTDNILYLIDLFWILNGPAHRAFERVYRDAFLECWLKRKASGTWPEAGRTLLERALQQLEVACPIMRVKVPQGLEIDYNFAGMLAVTDPELGSILYLPGRGLTYYADRSQLLQALAADAQARETLAMGVRELFDTPDRRELKLEPITSDPMKFALRSIINAQRSNLITAMEITRRAEHSALNTVFDDVLDIRHLADPCLEEFDIAGRWLDAHPEQQIVLDIDIQPAGTEADVRALLANCMSWRQEQSLAGMSVSKLVEGLLQPSLVPLGSGLKASQVFLQLPRQGNPASRISLHAALLERITGLTPGPLPKQTKVILRNTHGRIAAPPIEWVEEVLERVAPSVLERWAASLKKLLWSGFRQGGRWWPYASLMQQTRQRVINLDIELARRKENVGASQLSAFEQALWKSDTVRTLVAVDPDGHSRARLKEVVALQTGTTPSGSWICWSAFNGLEQSASQAALIAHWLTALADDTLRDQLLGGAQPASWSERLPASVTLIIEPMQDGRIDPTRPELPEPLRTGVSGALTVLEANARADEIQPLVKNARQLKMPGDVFDTLLSASLRRDDLQPAIARLQQAWGQLEVAQLMVGQWPRASDQDKQAFGRHLRRILAAPGQGRDFLAGMPRPGEIITQYLAHQLAGWGEWQVPTAERLMVVSAEALPGAQGTPFIDYAMRHCPGGRPNMQLRSIDGTPLPILVSQLDVHDLVRAIDWGSALARWLSAALGLHLFDDGKGPLRALSWQMSLAAHAQYLQGALSDRALRLVERIVQAPDAIARATLPGEPVRMGKLRAGEQAISGCFMIQSPAGGPLVLLCLYYPENAFQEFSDLNDFKSRLADASTLDNLLRQYGLADGAHELKKRSSAGDIAIDWLQGNALTTLVQEIGGIIQGLASAQFEDDGHRWERFIAFVEKVVEHGALLLPQPLQRLFQGWKVVKHVEKLYKAVSERRWNDVFEDLVAAGGAALGVPDPNQAPQPAPAPGAAATPDFSWRVSGLDADLRQRLLPYEARAVALDASALQSDGTYHLGATAYAVLGGKVFEVVRESQGWRIVKTGEPQGPLVEPVAGAQWRLLGLGLRGGGCIGSCGRATDVVLAEAGETFTIQAASLSALWAKYPTYADLLHRALTQIARWLTRAWQRLSPSGATEIQVVQCFSSLFGPIRASESTADFQKWESGLVLRLKGVIEQLHSELIRLRAGRGERWVYGHNHPQHPDALAFVVRPDERGRIFLTNQLFNPAWLDPVDPRAQGLGFDARCHFIAAHILHEITHLVLDTVDIDYVEASATFTDLLGSGIEIDRLNELIGNQALMTDATPSLNLFAHLEYVQRNAPQLIAQSLGFQRLYQLTNTHTLAAARQAFQNQRSVRTEVILANADSLTLLIIRLGRDIPLLV